MKIIAELKVGIDPTSSDLINGNINSHFLLDENNILCLTKYTGTITDDYFNPVSNILAPDDAGTSNPYWTLQAGNILQINA